jgi:hypothetical protein
MSYAEVKGDIVYQYPYTFQNLQAENPFTNYGDNQNFTYWFPLTDAATVDGKELVYVRQLEQPSYDPYTQNCNPNNNPHPADGEWVDGWTVSEKTPEEQEAYKESIRQQNKQVATDLLAQTDWTTIPDVSDPALSDPYLANQSAFFAYRSEVRAIAVNPPDTVINTWPAPPAEEWQYSQSPV